LEAARTVVQLEFALSDLDVSAFPKERERISCVYTIKLLDPKHPDRPLTVPRMMGSDKEGRLEIASTTDLSREMWHFKGSFFKTASTNPSGWNLRYIYERSGYMQRLFGSPRGLFDRVMVQYEEGTKKDMLGVRQGLLDSYMSEFAEPPLIQGLSRIFMTAKLTADKGFEKVQISRPEVLDPRSVKGVSCIYWAHLMDPKDPTRTWPLRRFGMTDPLGTLVAGKTKDLERKILHIRSNMVHYKESNRGEWGLFGYVHGLCGPLGELCGPLEDFKYKIGISYAAMGPGRLGRGEIWALNRSISEYGEMPPFNSQIPGDTRYER